MIDYTARLLRVLFLICYIFVAFSATLYHAHDSDAYAGYDEHCTSCHWTTHTPIAVGTPYKFSYPLALSKSLPLAQANPSDFTAFTKRTGRSPPQVL